MDTLRSLYRGGLYRDLSDYTCSVFSFFTDTALKYVQARIIKLNKGDDYNKPIEKLKNKVQRNPNFLLINIFDEAHHGATSNEEKDTTYEKCVNPWNSTVSDIPSRVSEFKNQNVFESKIKQIFIPSDQKHFSLVFLSLCLNP